MMVLEPSPFELLIPQRRSSKPLTEPMQQNGFAIQICIRLIVYTRSSNTNFERKAYHQFL
jgi:hypothetical protein